MAKRIATSKLDHENWDAEEPPEDAGTFSSAATEVLKKRVILKAQRRGRPTSSGESGAAPVIPNIFQMIKLTGSSSATPSPSFSFLSKNVGDNPKTESPVPKPQPSFVVSSTTPTEEGPSRTGDAKSSVTSTATTPVSDGVSVATATKPDASSPFASPTPPAVEATAAAQASAVFGNKIVFTSSPLVPTIENGKVTVQSSISTKMTSVSPKTDGSKPTMGSAIGSKTVAKSGAVSPGMNGDQSTMPSLFGSKTAFADSAVSPSTDGSKQTPSQPLFGNIFGNRAGKPSSPETSPDKTEIRTDTGQFNFMFSDKKHEASSKHVEKPLSTENGNNKVNPPSPNSFIDKDKYYLMLKGLNNSVANWIKENVDKNPHCILTPIFSDYITHLNDIKAKYGKRSSTVSKNKNELSSVPVPSSSQDEEKTSPSKTLMVNGKDKDQGATSFLSPLGQGSAPQPKSSADKPQVSTPFTFSAFASQKTFSKPETNAQFLFATFDRSADAVATGSSREATAESKADRAEANDDEDGEPPEPAPAPVVEEGAVYSKRCKVFIKKSGSYQDRGVGTAFIKPVMDSTKTQLIVRADTVLGNVLLNTLLSSSVPLQRLGPNNVMVVCVPTPDEKPPPATVLLRVKTTADADELYEQLMCHKK